MKQFIYTANDPLGKRVTNVIPARDARAAVERLTTDGFTDIELRTDDLTTTTTDSPASKVRPGFLLKIRTAGRLGAYLIIVQELYRRYWFPLLLLIATIAIRRYNHNDWSLIDWSLAIGLVIPFVTPFLAPRHSGQYAQLQSAVLRTDWAEVRRLADRLAPVLSKIGSDGILELTYWRARSMLGLGQRREAFDELNALRARSDIPIGRLLWRISTLHMAENDYAASRAVLEEAVALAPDDLALWIGLAELLASHLNEPATARDALKRARSFPLSEQTREALSGIEAHIALCEGRYEEARRGIEAAIARIRQQEAATPLARGLRHVTEAALVVACARSGDPAAAQRAYASCRDFLRLHQDTSLLARAESALRDAGVPIER